MTRAAIIFALLAFLLLSLFRAIDGLLAAAAADCRSPSTTSTSFVITKHFYPPSP